MAKKHKIQRIRQDVKAYCMKCKEKQFMEDPVKVLMANGRPAAKGTCPVCGAGMFKIGEVH